MPGLSFLVELLVGAVKELDTIAADHHENMLALVDDFKLLALFLVAIGVAIEPVTGIGVLVERLALVEPVTLPRWLHAGYTVRKPCTSGYMVAT